MTTYKIKKEFTPMDFYDYVKSQGQAGCEEFKKDFQDWVTFAPPFYKYNPDMEVANQSGAMLSERANFRKYMIEGGFVEEEKLKVDLKISLVEDPDSFEIVCNSKKNRWTIARIYKDGRGMAIAQFITDPDIETDKQGRIKIL